MKRLVAGVGTNDADYPVSIKGVVCPIYTCWVSMLHRCKSAKAYHDCFVCDDWMLFSNFERWAIKHYKPGLQLDKDIKVPGNRVYCPERCLFVTAERNARQPKYKTVKFMQEARS